jgi:hypothetical protein
MELIDIFEEVADHAMERLMETVAYSGRYYSYYLINNNVYPNVHSIEIEYDVSKPFLFKKETLTIQIKTRTRELTDIEIVNGCYNYQQTDMVVSKNKELISKFKELQKMGHMRELDNELKRKLRREEVVKQAIKNSISGVIE